MPAGKEQGAGPSGNKGGRGARWNGRGGRRGGRCSSLSRSGDTTTCKATPAILHRVVFTDARLLTLRPRRAKGLHDVPLSANHQGPRAVLRTSCGHTGSGEHSPQRLRQHSLGALPAAPLEKRGPFESAGAVEKPGGGGRGGGEAKGESGKKGGWGSEKDASTGVPRSNNSQGRGLFRLCLYARGTPVDAALLATFFAQYARVFVSLKVFLKSFCRSHKSVNLSFVITNMKNKLTDLSVN